MGLLALAIAPGIAICLFIYFKDKYNREPLGLLILSFFMGVLSIIPAVIFQIALTKPVERIMGEGIFYIAVFSYLIVALSEEYSKFLAVRFVPYRRKAFDASVDLGGSLEKDITGDLAGFADGLPLSAMADGDVPRFCESHEPGESIPQSASRLQTTEWRKQISAAKS